MRKTNYFAMAIMLFSMLASCSSESDEVQVEIPQDKDYFNVVFCDSNDGNTGSYTQALTDLSEGEITFNGKGFEIPSTRTAYIFTSDDGKTFYNYSYGGGTFTNFKVNGGSKYSKQYEINVTPFTGSDYSRCSKLTDELASAHNVISENISSEDGVYQTSIGTAKFSIINLQKMIIDINATKSFVIPKSESDLKNNSYVYRVHMPLIVKDKIYYGIARVKQKPSKPSETDKTFKAPAGTLVLDFPSMTNPKVIETGVEEAIGDTYGYRMTPAHVDEAGDIYQMTMTKSHILRIKDSEYDNSYSLDLQKALGLSNAVKANGFFYCGNGIAYAPYEELKGDGGNNWSVARIDLYSKSAIKLNVPENLYLWYYQSAKLVDGKLYMALCPEGADGNVYIFDTKSTSADGFVKGATLKSSSQAYYSGIF